MEELQVAAQILGVRLQFVYATTAHDFGPALATLLEARASGLVIGNDGLLITQSVQLAALAFRHGIPAISQFPEFVTAGGVMSYGGSHTDAWGLAGAYVARILKGEKPSDLPVQRATKIELILNLKTAKALGITVPLTLRGRADEVIE